MDDLPDKAEAYRTTTSYLPDNEREPCPSCGTPWIWIILFIAALLAIIGLVVWLIWLYHKNSTCKGQQIELKDANIEVSTSNSIKGTWAPLKNSSDTVILYATLHPPKFNSTGGLDNVSAQKLFQKAAPGSTSVVLTGLQPRLKYYATLIATSSKSNNYQVYTQLVYMQDGSINPSGVTGSANTFAIQDIIQIGAIQLASETPISGSTGTYNVEYNQTPTDTRRLFFYNANGQIQSSETNSALQNVCLFNDNGVLHAQECVTGGGVNDKWSYNPASGKFANRWCLTSTVGTDTPTCMVLTPIQNGTASVTVTTPTTVGDSWALQFENRI